MAIWKSLIVCDPAPSTSANFEGPVRDCDWAALIELIRVLIHDMVVLSTLLAVAVFSWIGFLFLTSGGNISAKETAKKMFIKVIKGYLWILFAWLVVYTITNTLLKPGYTLLTP